MNADEHRYLARILHEGGRTMINLCRVFNELPKNKRVYYGYTLSVWFYEQSGVAS